MPRIKNRKPLLSCGKNSVRDSFYLLEKTAPHVIFRVRVFRGENERGFAHDEIFGDGTDVAGITGVENFITGDKIPVFPESVLSDKAVIKIDLSSSDVERGLGFVGDYSLIQGVIGRVDRDGTSRGRDVKGTEILNVPDRKSVV